MYSLWITHKYNQMKIQTQVNPVLIEQLYLQVYLSITTTNPKGTVTWECQVWTSRENTIRPKAKNHYRNKTTVLSEKM